VTPTQRTKKMLKDLGYDAIVVERWNAWAKIRQDCKGVDILAFKAGEPLLAIQTTTGEHHADHCDKLKLTGNDRLWKGCGVALEVWSWSKRGARGERKVWTVRREAL
jgi:hypothetical protein